MDRAELLMRMRAGRQKLADALARVDEKRMGDVVLHEAWSVKDLLAHLGFWERRVVALYQTLVRGGEWNNVEGDAALDQLNAQALQEGRSYSLDEVRRQEDQAWRAVLSLAETAPDVDLFGPDRFAWTHGQPFYNWIAGNTYGHYEEHLPELLGWLDRINAEAS